MKGKRIFRVIGTALCVLIFALASCQAGKDASPSGSSASQASVPIEPVITEADIEYGHVADAEKAAYFAKYYARSDKLIHLTQNMRAGDPINVWNRGESINENNYTRWAERTVGIKWTASWNAVSQEEDTQKLALAMASDDLPDLIRAETSVEILKMAEAGQILPLNDYIEKYASPLTKYVLLEMDNYVDGNYFKKNSYNGKLYALNIFDDGVASHAINWRADILAELGYTTPPSKLNEVEEVFAKYKQKYPNNPCLNLSKELDMGLNAVFLAYGTLPGSWIKQADGTLAYAPVLPQTKDALAKLHEWYEKGYIDREFAVKDNNKVNEQWMSGNMLSEQGEWSIIWGDHRNLQSNVPSAKIIVGESYVGPKGDYGYLMTKPNRNNQQALNSKLSEEAVKAIFMQLNYTIDSEFRARPDQSEKFTTFYPYQDEVPPDNTDVTAAARVGGADAVVRDMYPIPQELEGPSNMSSSWMASSVLQYEQFGFIFMERPNGMRNNFLVMEKAIKSNDTAFLDKNNLWYMHRHLTTDDMESLFTNIHISEKLEEEGHAYFDEYWGPPTPTQLQKNAYLKKLEESAFTAIIMGQKPVDSFDQFVRDWNANGGTEITKEVNEWTNSTK
ncbi:hypothetical protein FACS1894109_16510 [Spirochaetia bacterium]|nr:hypothetical protein FACS1894109_16510 [Spirochaetia bacterium]